ncbi:MAG: PH domain-containing protein [Microbacteriaceae bacterium]|nr:PH domain-containing protein [Microbacteriaceae bacterium]
MSDRLELPAVTWRPISAKYLIAEFLGLLVTLLVALTLGVALIFTGWDAAPWILGVAVAVVLLYASLTPRRVRAIGYQLRDDDLLFRRGILFRRIVAVPYGRMQLVDINRGPLLRTLGLSDLRLVTAAASTGVAIPGLPEAEAEELRDHLVALAESRRAGI